MGWGSWLNPVKAIKKTVRAARNIVRDPVSAMTGGLVSRGSDSSANDAAKAIEAQQKKLEQERQQMENRNRQRSANEEGLIEQRDNSAVGNPNVLTDPEYGDGLIVGYRKLNKKKTLGA